MNVLMQIHLGSLSMCMIVVLCQDGIQVSLPLQRRPAVPGIPLSGSKRQKSGEAAR